MNERPKPASTSEIYAVGNLYTLTATSKPGHPPGWVSFTEPSRHDHPPISLSREDALTLYAVLGAVLGVK